MSGTWHLFQSLHGKMLNRSGPAWRQTWVYFRTVFDSFDPDYILKTDDDLYTRCVLPDQLHGQAMRSVLQGCRCLWPVESLSWCLASALQKHWHLGQAAILAGSRSWAPCGQVERLPPVLQEIDLVGPCY